MSGIDLSFLGLNAQTLSEHALYKPQATGKVLLLDGDGYCYEAAANAAKQTTAMSRFEREILGVMLMAGCETARVHLTPSGCLKNGRGLLLGAKPYQANRSNKKKPAHLEYLRSPASTAYFENHPHIQIILNYKIEADDALMIDHYHYHNGILVSPDKDLNITPFQSYIVEEAKHVTLPQGDRYGWIDRKHWLTTGGKPASKMVGKGTKFFLAQLLMGDTADNVKGILKLNGKLCGEGATHEFLMPITDEHEAVNLIIEAYKKIDQNIIPEAEAMWLLRNPTDSAYKYLSEHDLTDSNLNYLNECYYERKWKLDEDDLEYNDEL